MEAQRRKQKKKAGRVVRVNPATEKIIEAERRDRETQVKTIERLIRAARRGRTFYVLPESRLVCDSLSDARGKAILAAVMRKKSEAEEPIKVQEVISG